MDLVQSVVRSFVAPVGAHRFARVFAAFSPDVVRLLETTEDLARVVEQGLDESVAKRWHAPHSVDGVAALVCHDAERGELNEVTFSADTGWNERRLGPAPQWNLYEF